MQDDKFYEEVAKELLDGSVQAGVWARAFSDAEGDKEKAKAIYIRLRVQQLNEGAVDSAAAAAASAEKRASDAATAEWKTRQRGRFSPQRLKRKVMAYGTVIVCAGAFILFALPAGWPEAVGLGMVIAAFGLGDVLVGAVD